MNKTTVVMLILAGILSLYAFLQGGMELVSEAIIIAGQTLFSIIPILIVAFLIAGLISTLISKDTASSTKLGRIYL